MIDYRNRKFKSLKIKWKPSSLFFILTLLSGGLIITSNSCKSAEDVENVESKVWSLDNQSAIGGISPVIIGSPQIVPDGPLTAFTFNGDNEGLIVPVNPVAGWKSFTMEVLFKPSSLGEPAQRFVHFQDIHANRGLIEIRITSEGKWCLDTYLHVGPTGNGYTLVDRSKEHPCDEWHWAALVYDGKTMRHYVNAVEELSGDIEFGPMGPGLISLGVRLNQIFWFKGMISEIRFHSTALGKGELQEF